MTTVANSIATTGIEPEAERASAEQPAVHISGLHKSYGSTPVLRGVGLTVETGSLTAVLGASGSGKTTMLRVIAGFERADAGLVQLGGATVDDARRALPPEKRRIGYVPQDGALFPHLTVRGNIGFALPRAQRKSGRIEELLTLTGLEGLAARYPHELSGGQQQRVALARALAPRPNLILLDEPFSALDAALRASVRTEVLSVLRATGTTAVLVTHDQDEALSSADHIAVLRAGLMVQCGTAQELYDTPADPQLACFLGDANLVKATLTADAAHAGALGPLPLRVPAGAVQASDSAGTALIRPEQFAVTMHESADAVAVEPGPGAIHARIERCEYFGHDRMLTVRPHATDTGVPDPALPETLLARLSAGPRLPVGATVTLTVRGPITAWTASQQAA